MPRNRSSWPPYCRVGEIVHPFCLAPAKRHSIQYETADEAEEAEQHRTGSEHSGRESRHEASLEIGDEDRNADRAREQRERNKDRAEKRQRALLLHQIENVPAD